MRRLTEVKRDEEAMATLTSLTGVFEGIASMHIAQIKTQVLSSTQFFNELWHIYSQINVSPVFGFGRGNSDEKIIDKELYILITAEGGFSGDIDQKLIRLMSDNYDEKMHDIIVIGHHGAIQLAQRGIKYQRYFKLPSKDQNINVSPIVREVQKYRQTTVYYQQYVSLMIQDVKRISLSSVVQQSGKAAKIDNSEFISESNYIFEPSTYEVIDHLERSMMQIAVSQLILDSKLAQYASRFRAMSASHERAEEDEASLRLDYNRVNRALKDERLKETVNGLKKRLVRMSQ